MIKPLLSSGDTVGIIACSDGMRENQRDILTNVIRQLNKLGLKIELANTIFRVQAEFSGTALERAYELMRLFANKDVKAIFDISGGDSANQILPYLNYQVVKQNAKPCFGISDLTVLLNALNTCCNIPTYHYMIRNLADEYADRQLQLFNNSFLVGQDDIYNFNYNWLRGNEMQGKVIGGNIRCFLKLAGTKYLPDPNDKILFLESLGGSANRMGSLLAQLKQMNYLHKLRGIILGTFSQLESEKTQPTINELTLNITKELNTPVIKTNQLGHGKDSRCLVIGRELTLK